jgi:hypothetical protein
MPTLDLTMTGHSITVTGTELSGAVNVVSTVSGAKQVEPRLLYLYPGVADQDAINAAIRYHGDPNAMEHYGQYVFDAFDGPGTSSAQTVLAPGHYLALDTESNDPATWPNAAFTVAQNPTPALLPGASQSETAIEFGFRGNKHLYDGRMTRFQNNGWMGHSILGIRAKDEKKAKKLSKYLLQGNFSQAKKLSHGYAYFAGPLSTGGVQQFTLNQKPGWYVLVCFLKTEDGRSEAALGMSRVVEILK